MSGRQNVDITTEIAQIVDPTKKLHYWPHDQIGRFGQFFNITKAVHIFGLLLSTVEVMH
jgi:hypothetical protein